MYMDFKYEAQIRIAGREQGLETWMDWFLSMVEFAWFEIEL
jgi:hypothetical protein